MPEEETTGEERTISIQIPEGAEAGDELSFLVAGGQELTIPVPMHSKPGDVLQLQIQEVDTGTNTSRRTGDTTDNNNMDTEEEEEDSSILLMTGQELRLAPHPSATTTAASRTDGTFRCVWPASKFVIDYLNDTSASIGFHHLIRNEAPIRCVLELGAGQGMFGMAFAAIVASAAAPSPSPSNSTCPILQVTLTDMDEAVDSLRRNVQVNQHFFPENRVQFSTVPLTWHSTPVAATGCSLDFLLGSDLLYNIDHIPDLAATVRRLLSPSTKVLLSVRWRKPAEERSFFVSLSDVLEWEVLHGACRLDYRRYGNPACDESNHFFEQTMISCNNGQLLPLSMIDEVATSQMTAVEFEAFEALQTQVYLGRVVEKSATLSSGGGQDTKRQKTT